MASLAFKALHYGAEKIPDEVFHAIPGGYFRPPQVEEERRRKKEKKRREKERRRQSRKGTARESTSSSPDSSDSDSDGSQQQERQPKQKAHRRQHKPKHRRGSSYIDREYESDHGPSMEPGWHTYFPPPPTRAVDDPPDADNRPQNYYQPQNPYNPADFGAQAGTRDEYYSQHPHEFTPYDPTDIKNNSEHSRVPEGYIANRSLSVDPNEDHNYVAPDTSRFSSSANRAVSEPRLRERHGRSSANGGRYSPRSYTPSAFNPPQVSSYPAAPYSPAYASGYAGQDPMGAFPPPPVEPAAASEQPTYAPRTALTPYQHPGMSPPSELPVFPPPPRAHHTGYYSPTGPGHSRSRSRSSSRNRSSRRRSTKIREQLREHKDLGAAALGALAGGLVARELGHGSGISTLVGAAVGGIGGKIAERKYQEEKRHRRRRMGEHHDPHPSDDDEGYDSY